MMHSLRIGEMAVVFVITIRADSGSNIVLSAGIRANVRRVNAQGKPADTAKLLPARANLQHPTAPAAAHVDFDAQTTDPGADDLRASRQSF